MELILVLKQHYMARPPLRLLMHLHPLRRLLVIGNFYIPTSDIPSIKPTTLLPQPPKQATRMQKVSQTLLLQTTRKLPRKCKECLAIGVLTAVTMIGKSSATPLMRTS
ncbi:unnamed protein product [Amoebophrya sp. A25]|nr:unnamed protein product [Amoebophrya sp. A25]|eukprot:GSA25T00020377001.1